MTTFNFDHSFMGHIKTQIVGNFFEIIKRLKAMNNLLKVGDSSHVVSLGRGDDWPKLFRTIQANGVPMEVASGLSLLNQVLENSIDLLPKFSFGDSDFENHVSGTVHFGGETSPIVGDRLSKQDVSCFDFSFGNRCIQSEHSANIDVFNFPKIQSRHRFAGRREAWIHNSIKTNRILFRVAREYCQNLAEKSEIDKEVGWDLLALMAMVEEVVCKVQHDAIVVNGILNKKIKDQIKAEHSVFNKDSSAI